MDEQALEKGRRAYPEAHWLFYDRYCFFFNPRGVPRLKLPDTSRTKAMRSRCLGSIV